MDIKIVSLVFMATWLYGCSSTMVVLVPDAAGKVGEVSVETGAGTAKLTKAMDSTEVSGSDQAPSIPVPISEENMQAIFSDTLKHEPMPPERFRLYFATDTTELAAAATEQLSRIASAIQKHKSCDLSVIGHSDRTGDAAYNKTISLQRAARVAQVLTASGVASECMDIRYYGENDPAIPTPDNVGEARNRRVEVEIR